MSTHMLLTGEEGVLLIGVMVRISGSYHEREVGLYLSRLLSPWECSQELTSVHKSARNVKRYLLNLASGVVGRCGLPQGT